jgi:glycosyltransferase involved in cell wall biosynthesis
MDTNFLIVVTVYNSEKYIGDCIKSVLIQDYKKFTLIVIDDNSTDKTSRIIKSIRKEHDFKYHKNKERLSSAVGNIVKAINMCPGDREDVIVIIDGDDWLYDKDVLRYLNWVYQNKDVWLTYGQFTSISGKLENYCQPLTDTRKYRKRGGWTTSHLKTMKRFLWNKINDKDLRDKRGEYFKRFEDIVYMYPAVEMAGLKHIKHIGKILYVYNDGNSMCSLNEYNEKNRLKQIWPIKLEILRKPCYPELNEI